MNLAIKGAVGFGQKGLGLLKSCGGFAKNGFSHSFTGTIKDFFTKGKDFSGIPLKAFAAAGLISVPTAIFNFSNIFDDLRRNKEIKTGEANFHTDKDAALNTMILSGVGLAGSLATGLAGLALGGKASGLITVAGTIAATAALTARTIYKNAAIDLPFKPNSDLGLLSLNKPLFRVEDPSSPYYMQSHLLEKSMKKRALQNAQPHKEGYLEWIEKAGDKVSNYLFDAKA